jgi:hypothetical protein
MSEVTTAVAEVVGGVTEKRTVKRNPLDYKVFEVSEEEGEDGAVRFVLIEVDVAKPDKPGSSALLASLKAQIKAGDDSFNGKTLVVAGLTSLLKVKVESKRVVSFD